ncbi:MAG: glycoside hydrolase family 127 protein, partial [Calditrichaceae bacterium]
MSRILYIVYILILTLLVFSCNSDSIDNSIQSTCKVMPFELKDIKLLDGPFKHATELNIESLQNYEPDRFLSKFRITAGLKPKAESYGGWEAETLAGHSLGHYLSGCA